MANRLPVLFLPGDVFGRLEPQIPVYTRQLSIFNIDYVGNDCFRPGVGGYFDRINRQSS